MGVELSVPSSERLERLVDLRGDNFEMIPPSQDDMVRQIPYTFIEVWLLIDTGVVLFTSAWSFNVGFGSGSKLLLRRTGATYATPRILPC